MRTQIEKSKIELIENIEQLAERDITDAVATRLCTYHGAYKALRMLECEAEAEPETKISTATARTVTRTATTGGTEFEQVIAETPADWEHMTAVMEIIGDHMEGLKVMNRRKYDNIILRLKEVARS